MGVVLDNSAALPITEGWAVGRGGYVGVKLAFVACCWRSGGRHTHNLLRSPSTCTRPTLNQGSVGWLLGRLASAVPTSSGASLVRFSLSCSRPMAVNGASCSQRRPSRCREDGGDGGRRQNRGHLSDDAVGDVSNMTVTGSRLFFKQLERASSGLVIVFPTT